MRAYLTAVEREHHVAKGNLHGRPVHDNQSQLLVDNHADADAVAAGRSINLVAKAFVIVDCWGSFGSHRTSSTAGCGLNWIGSTR